MNDFDQATRFQVKSYPDEHFAWLFPRAARTMRWSRWLDSQSAPRSGEKDRRCDTIAEVVHREGRSHPRAVVLELFTNPDPEALDRTGEYLWRFRRELRHGPHDRDKYPFVGVLLFLTGRCAERETFADLPDEADVGHFFQPRVVELAAQDAVVFLDDIEHNRLPAALLPWTVLMQRGQAKETAERWAALALRLSEPERRLAAGVAATFAELVDCESVWSPELRSLAVNESKLFREIRTQAYAERQRDNLVRVLRTKMSGETLQAAISRIEDQADLATLSRWFDVALTESPETLLAEMSR